MCYDLSKLPFNQQRNNGICLFVYLFIFLFFTEFKFDNNSDYISINIFVNDRKRQFNKLQNFHKEFLDRKIIKKKIKMNIQTSGTLGSKYLQTISLQSHKFIKTLLFIKINN